MKKITAVLCALILCIGLAGCSSSGTISTYTIVLDAMPKNLDPQVATSPEELMAITNTFDCLFDYIDGKVVPNVCSSYTESEDGLSYSFSLREDSFFYKSKTEQIPVTAHDFAFALERILDVKTNSPYRSDFSNIKTISCRDDYTLDITLNKPDSSFLYKLSLPCSAPCNEEFFQSTKGAYGLTVKDILSNGPFTVNYLADDGSYATLIRVAENQGDIDRIRISLNKGESTPAAMYAEDRVSGFFASEKDEAEGTAISSSRTDYVMLFNPQKETLANRNIRAALAYYCYGVENSGANPDAVTPHYTLYSDDLTFGGQPLNSLITAKRPDYMEVADGKDLLSEGFSQLGSHKTEKLTVLVPNDVKYSIIVENINQLWQKKLTMFLSLEFLPSHEIEARVAKGSYDIAFLSFTPSVNSPAVCVQPFVQHSAAAAECYEAINSLQSSSVILKKLEAAQNDIINQALAVPMCTDSSYYIHRDYFSDVVVNPFGNLINLKYAKAK